MARRIKISEQGSSEPHLTRFSQVIVKDSNQDEEQRIKLEALRIINQKKAESYDPEKWILNRFLVGPTPIFALEKNTNGSDNIFNQMRRTIQHYSKGTIFEKEIMNDYNAFAHKW